MYKSEGGEEWFTIELHVLGVCVYMENHFKTID